MDGDQEYYLTVKEVADLFRISKMSVHRAINRGELAATKVFGSVRIHGSSVEAVASSRMVTPPVGE